MFRYVSTKAQTIARDFGCVSRRVRAAYTLVEVLVVVMVLGIAASMVIPEFGSTSVLRIQAAVRMVVSDIIEAQSEAIAFQQGRAIKFTRNGKRYQVAKTSGTTVDFALDTLEDRRFTGESFGNADFINVSFAGSDTLFFDELGSPVTAAGSGIAAPSGSVEVGNGTQKFRITVEAYTGRCTVVNLTP